MLSHADGDGGQSNFSMSLNHRLEMFLCRIPKEAEEMFSTSVLITTMKYTSYKLQKQGSCREELTLKFTPLTMRIFCCRREKSVQQYF